MTTSGPAEDNQTTDSDAVSDKRAAHAQSAGPHGTDHEQMINFLRNAVLYGEQRNSTGIRGITVTGSSLYALYNGEPYRLRLNPDGRSIDIAQVDDLLCAKSMMLADVASPEGRVRAHFQTVFNDGARDYLERVFRAGNTSQLPSVLMQITTDMLFDGRITVQTNRQDEEVSMGDGPSKEVLAANLRRLMAPGSLSHAKVATMAGLSPKTIGNVLNAEHSVSIDVIDALAAAFRVPTWRLLTPRIVELPDTEADSHPDGLQQPTDESNAARAR